MPTLVNIRKRDSDAECKVILRAMETSEHKLDFGLTEVDLNTGDGRPYSVDRVRLLCGSGVAFARSRLRLSGGLLVEIDRVSGTLPEIDERGVCYAIALAIAKALKRDPAIILEGEQAWFLGT